MRTTVEAHAPAAARQEPVEPAAEMADRYALTEIVAELVESLQEADFASLAVFWKDNRGIPREFDAKLLALASVKLGRRLERSEMQESRATFQKQVYSKLHGSTGH